MNVPSGRGGADRASARAVAGAPAGERERAGFRVTDGRRFHCGEGPFRCGRRAAFAVALALCASVAQGFENDEPLADPALEARAVALAQELRCLVCQNQSIAESDAPLARDLRALVRERVADGDSDAEVEAFVVARYGDFVLLRPPFKPRTWALWLGPPLILLAAALAVALARMRRRASPSPPRALDAAERDRLAALTGPDGDA